MASRSLLAQLGGARLGQRADQVHHLVAGHPDAVVADGQGAGLLVHLDLDVQIGGVDVEVLVAESLEPQLVQRVGGVRDQLPQEGVLVGVDRVDHQIQQLAGLGLELQLLDSCAHVIPFGNRWVFVVSILERSKMVAALTAAISPENHTLVIHPHCGQLLGITKGPRCGAGHGHLQRGEMRNIATSWGATRWLMAPEPVESVWDHRSRTE